jgi:cation diffusion facilitator CzcD-associated flavoprotein CzcO
MQGRDVFVVRTGNSAGQAALYLARYARQLTMLVRGDSLARSMSDYLVREIEVTPNIRVRLHTEVINGHGSTHLDTLTLHDRQHDQTEQIPAAALFVLIGGEPRTQWLPKAIQLKAGYILTGRDVVRVGAHAAVCRVIPFVREFPVVGSAGARTCGPQGEAPGTSTVERPGSGGLDPPDPDPSPSPGIRKPPDCSV